MNKKKRMRRSDMVFRLMIALSILISIVVALFVSAVGGSINPKTLLIVFFIVFVILITISTILSLPGVKGKIGEKIVSKVLMKLANTYGGDVIDDVMIPGENNRTSQIDHIYISEYGAFVVETKNYSGRIYGDDSQQQWTQVLAYGHSKHKLYNPVKQNQTHIYRLNQLMSTNVNFESVIVFVAGNVGYINSNYVYTLRELKRLITNNSPKTLSSSDVKRITESILIYKENPIKTNKEHVKEIKTMLRGVNDNICPRCGGKLILRQSKNGNHFYGCSNYPNCTFIKKI